MSKAIKIKFKTNDPIEALNYLSLVADKIKQEYNIEQAKQIPSTLDKINNSIDVFANNDDIDSLNIALHNKLMYQQTQNVAE